MWLVVIWPESLYSGLLRCENDMGEQSVKRGVPVLRTLLEIVKERKARAVRRAAEADDIFKGYLMPVRHFSWIS